MMICQLIEELSKFEPTMEVLIDVTTPFSKMFAFKDCNTVAEIETPEGDRFVVIANTQEYPEPNTDN